MKYALFAALALLVALSASCNREVCPSDEQIGTRSLDAATKGFIAYSGDETLVFQSQQGETLELAAAKGKETYKDKICVRETCSEPFKFGGGSSCAYVNAEAIRFVFSTPDHGFSAEISFFTQNILKDQESLYDIMRINLNSGATNAVAELLTKMRYTGDYSGHTLLSHPSLERFPELTLNGKTFNEVYANQSLAIPVYYTKNQGLVAFAHAGKLWVLQ
jgi:hypothetical protein